MIYFALAEAPVSRVKIGYSSLVEMRVDALRAWSPVPITLLCQAHGSRVAEGHIHWLLKEHRVQGEWFSAVAPVLELAASIAATDEIPGLDPYLRDWEFSGATLDVRPFLKAVGLSVSAAAEILGRSKTSVHNWRSGFPPHLAQAGLNLLRSRGLEISAEELFLPRRKPERSVA